MSKKHTVYRCQNCGYISYKWLGRCPSCGEWNTFVEEKDEKVKSTIPHPRENQILSIDDINIEIEERISTGYKEFDRVLGGGIVPGSLILLGGSPGIGKSTLLLQTANYISSLQGKVLYISGEESKAQIKRRAERLGASGKDLFLYSETNINFIKEAILEISPHVAIVDSIQTLYSPELESAPGSIAQIRECAGILMLIAKNYNIPIFIIGHITKSGVIAGPKALEHIVDTVLYFEGESYHSYRILRAIKNRFGSTNEIGVFEMKNNGLEEVMEPSSVFLTGKPEDLSGSIVVASIEGTRPILLEVQALVSYTNFTTPRRMSIGLDLNRLLLISAVLEKKLDIPLNNYDIYVNIVGGLKVFDPALDLGVSVSIASSYYDVPIDSKTLIIGEIGLTGEVRSVQYIDRRIKEAVKLGYKRIIVPYYNIPENYPKEVSIVGVETIKEVFRLLSLD